MKNGPLDSFTDQKFLWEFATKGTLPPAHFRQTSLESPARKNPRKKNCSLFGPKKSSRGQKHTTLSGCFFGELCSNSDLMNIIFDLIEAQLLKLLLTLKLLPTLLNSPSCALKSLNFRLLSSGSFDMNIKATPAYYKTRRT